MLPHNIKIISWPQITLSDVTYTCTNICENVTRNSLWVGLLQKTLASLVILQACSTRSFSAAYSRSNGNQRRSQSIYLHSRAYRNFRHFINCIATVEYLLQPIWLHCLTNVCNIDSEMKPCKVLNVSFSPSRRQCLCLCLFWKGVGGWLIGNTYCPLFCPLHYCCMSVLSEWFSGLKWFSYIMEATLSLHCVIT